MSVPARWSGIYIFSSRLPLASDSKLKEMASSAGRRANQRQNVLITSMLKKNVEDGVVPTEEYESRKRRTDDVSARSAVLLDDDYDDEEAAPSPRRQQSKRFDSPRARLEHYLEIGSFFLKEHADYYYILPKKPGRKAMECLSARFGADLRKLGFNPPYSDENPMERWVRSKDDPIDLWSLRTAAEEAEYEASIVARDGDPFAQI